MHALARASLAALLLLANPQILRSEETRPSPVIIQRKPCPGGCGQRGHCNYEQGRCECPWGYTGPSCQVDRMAACRQTEDDPGSCGFIMPKNCECYRECLRLYCHYGTDTDKCRNQMWGNDAFDASCWLYGNEAVGPSPDHPQNSSRYPDNPENETVWYGHVPEFLGMTDYTSPELRLKDPERRFKSPWDRPWLGWHRAPNVAQPLSRCPSACSNGRGFCIQRPDSSLPSPSLSAPVCICHYGYKGQNCSEEDPRTCWLSPSCSGRGRCFRGFCHCQDGFWGWGCHRSTAVQPAPGLVPEPAQTQAGGQELPPPPPLIPNLRSKIRFKIYMYDLPWEIAFPLQVTEEAYARDNMYTAYEQFLTYFLTDETVRTESPYEANLFYVPALLYFYTENVRAAQWQAKAALDYVQQQWPFFNRSGGRDHFIFMPGDRGSCHSERWLQDGVIKVVHFGMQKQNLNWTNIENKDYGCIQVKRDLVVATRTTHTGSLLPNLTAAHYQWLESTGGRDGNRTLLFFFAGGVADGEYSGGVRLAIKQLLQGLRDPPPDVKFFEGGIGDTYLEMLKTCKFCIAPYGHGWGIRLVQAIHFGCIPVIIQDYVVQPYEDFLPYEEFSVRMPLSDVPRMVELLRSYSEAHLAALRLGLARYFRAFIWEREFGGTAYEWTLAGLQRRAYNLDGQYFR